MSLGFAGDFCLGGGSIRKRTVAEICRDTAVFTELVDLTFANFESCIIENETTTTDDMTVPESQCHSISSSGINIFTLANNHIRDCGDEGLLLTKRVLNEQGISTVGAGEDIEEAIAPLVIHQKGKSIAFLGATDATHYKAEPKRPGVATLNPRRLQNTIRQLRDKVDLVVVAIHSDLEFTNFPAPWKVRISRQLARAGADIVVHHHPHTLQGIEMHDDCLIAYSLGNFVFPVHGMKYMENRDGYVDEAVFLKVVVDFDTAGRKTIAYELVPTKICEGNSIRMATGRRRDQIIEKVSQYSGYIDNSARLRKRYWHRCRNLAKSFVYGSYYVYRKDGARKMLEFARFHFSTLVHRTWMRGLISFGWL